MVINFLSDQKSTPIHAKLHREKILSAVPEITLQIFFFQNILVSSIDFLAIFWRLCTCHLVIDTLDQSIRTHKWNDTPQLDFMFFAFSHSMNFPVCWGRNPKSPKRLLFGKTEGLLEAGDLKSHLPSGILTSHLQAEAKTSLTQNPLVYCDKKR